MPYMESVVASARRGRRARGSRVSVIPLIHANELNADLMPELLAMFRRRGYTPVTLDVGR
jgi:hypothetical protein